MFFIGFDFDQNEIFWKWALSEFLNMRTMRSPVH